jgi:ATP synthase protein I
MHNLLRMHVRYQKYILSILSLAVIGWGFTAYKAIFLGFILGTIFSTFNLWNLVRKIDRFGKYAAEGKSVRSIGMFTRMASAILAVIIAEQYSDYFQLISVIVGLMTSYFVIMIDMLIQTIRKKLSSVEER